MPTPWVGLIISGLGVAGLACALIGVTATSAITKTAGFTLRAVRSAARQLSGEAAEDAATGGSPGARSAGRGDAGGDDPFASPSPSSRRSVSSATIAAG